MTYQLHQFDKTLLDGTKKSENFVKIVEGNTEIRSRKFRASIQDGGVPLPYVTFQLELDLNRHITAATQTGFKVFPILLASFSAIGGLFASFSGIVAIIVASWTTGEFTAYMTKNLFYMQRFNPKYAKKLNPREEEEARESQMIVAPRNAEFFEKIRKNTA